MSTAKTLLLKRPNIFWSSCAVHTINLILGDVGKIKPIRSTITMGILVMIYTYSYTKSHREKASGDIDRPGASRFATAFLSEFYER